MAWFSPSWYSSRLPYSWTSAAHKAKSWLLSMYSICSDWDPSQAHSIQPITILDSEPWTYQPMMYQEHCHFDHCRHWFGSIEISIAKPRVSEKIRPHRRPTALIFQGHYWCCTRSRVCYCGPLSTICTPGMSALAIYQKSTVLNPRENCFSYLVFDGGSVFSCDFRNDLNSLYPAIPSKVYYSDPAADWAR